MAIVDTAISMTDTSLNANSNALSYQWLDCENGMTPILGANSHIYIPDSSGTYAVEITTAQCMDTSSCHSFSALETEEFFKQYGMGVSLYPIPVTSELKIEFKYPDFYTIKLFNSSGQIVLTQSVYFEAMVFLDLSNFKNGAYQIQIADKKEAFTRQIIVQH